MSLGELKVKPENDEPKYPEPNNENTHLLMEKAKVNEQEIQKLKIQASQVKKKWPKGDYCIWAGKENWCPTAFHHLRREMKWVLKYADFNISHGYYQEIGSTHIGYVTIGIPLCKIEIKSKKKITPFFLYATKSYKKFLVLQKS